MDRGAAGLRGRARRRRGRGGRGRRPRHDCRPRTGENPGPPARRRACRSRRAVRRPGVATAGRPADHRPVRARLRHRVLPARPAQGGVQPAAAVRQGHHGHGTDDRDRRLVRLPDDQGRTWPRSTSSSATPRRPRSRSSRRPGRSRCSTPAPTTWPAGRARPRWTWSTRTPSRRARTSCWPRPRSPRPREPPASRRSSPTEKYVIDHHSVDVISQSFSATEETFASLAQLNPLRAAYRDAYAHHVTVLAASGDSGRHRLRARPAHVLHPPGDVLAGQRPAGDGGRRHPADPGRRQVHVGGLERHRRHRGGQVL